MTSNSPVHEVHNQAGFSGSLHATQRSQIESALAQCFQNTIVSASPSTIARLRVTTTRLAETKRRDGTHPERALVELKALLRDPTRQLWKPSLEDTGSRSGVSAQLYRRLFEWWLAAYFASPSNRGTTDRQAMADAQ